MVEASRGEIRSSRIRQINKPRSISIIEDKDRKPSFLEYKGNKSKVLKIEDYWLVKDRWWTEQPIYRSYYKIVTVQQDIFVIYRDLMTNVWYKVNWY